MRSVSFGEMKSLPPFMGTCFPQVVRRRLVSLLVYACTPSWLSKIIQSPQRSVEHPSFSRARSPSSHQPTHPLQLRRCTWVTTATYTVCVCVYTYCATYTTASTMHESVTRLLISASQSQLCPVPSHRSPKKTFQKRSIQESSKAT